MEEVKYAQASTIIYLVLGISLFLALVFVYLNLSVFLDSPEMPSYFGSFFGIWLGFLSAMAAVAYAYDLQVSREKALERKELAALAVALRAECRNVTAMLAQPWSYLDRRVGEAGTSKDGDQIEIAASFFESLGIPPTDLVAQAGIMLPKLGAEIAESILMLHHSLIAARTMLKSETASLSKRPKVGGGETLFLPLHALKTMREWMEEAMKISMQGRTLLSLFVGGADPGPTSMAEIKSTIDKIQRRDLE